MSSSRSIRIVIAGGGTGGHVLPAISVVEEIRRRGIEAEYFWIGGTTEVERSAAERAGIRFASVATGKFRRYLDRRMMPDLIRMPVGAFQARRLIREFKPDVIFATGGFVSVPSVCGGSRCAPVLTHEQTTTIGLATKINARFSSRVALSYESTRALASGYSSKVIVTGNPVRLSLLGGDRRRAFNRYGFQADLPLLYVTGGARGASPLNKRIERLLPGLLEICQVLHQTGPANPDQDDANHLRNLRSTWSPELQARYQITEYVGEELADVYAAATLLVARAGAGTIAELALIGIPSILIPLPGTSSNEQLVNARLLESVGAALVIEQSGATPDRLLTEIESLLGDPYRLSAMAANAKSLGRPEAAARIVDELLALARL